MHTSIIRTCQTFAIVALLTACGGGGGSSPIDVTNSGGTPADGVLRSADANSPYKQTIVNCVKIVNDNPVSFCKLATLPFIGQVSSAPTKATILAQTVVSHPWMATRFGQLLDQMPDDIFKLFRGVTAVVISADIRPSHYRSDTGAIYLDPADLWLIKSERDTISQEEDFRSGFSNGLGFRSLWRYVKNGDDAFGYFPLNGSITSRSIGDIVPPMADLLFHELAHANDFMQPASLALLDSQLTADAAITSVASSRISTSLTAQAPLNSQMQFDLADVMFWGEKATDAQKLLTPLQVGLDFEVDGANDSYNYSSKYEDVAMLFEEVMMKYHFNTDRQIAFTDAPPATNATCANYVVRWGLNNRIGQSLAKSRAQIIVQKVLGTTNTTKYFTNLPAPHTMMIGVDWCNNLSSSFASRAGGVLQKPSQEPVPERNLLPID
jgi:hypothetical protein